jgi:hypothetical protein
MTRYKVATFLGSWQQYLGPVGLEVVREFANQEKIYQSSF